ncbi:MAG: 2-oxo acid dehydrogenase subunit E2, partial [Flavobacteriaceae bacterium]|nr:2-oxo acid dehydrogenase subunit E2 [Flavobacteriaceae bacterium]
MAIVVNMPRLSDTMEEGVVAKWLKQIGDKIEEGDILAEIETDKATMEFESFNEGTLLHIGVQEGETSPVDVLLAIIGEEGEDISGILNGASPEETPQEVVKEETNQEPITSSIPDGIQIISMPRLSDTMEEGTVASWLKNIGDKVEEGDILAEIETDKATMEFESFYEGVLLYIGVGEGESAKVDSLLTIIGPEGTDVSALITAHNEGSISTASIEAKKETSTTETKQIEEQAAVISQSNNTGGRIFASPLAKKIAKDKGINLADVKGSGENGRIVKKDVESYTPAAAVEATPTQTIQTVTPLATYTPVGEESYEDVKNSQMRKVIAKRLGESKFTAPHYYLTIELDMDNAIASRKTINSLPETKVSFNDMVVKACAMALKKHPQVNTSWNGDTTRYNHHIHIGVAVAVDDGLLVPVLKFTDQMSLTQIGGNVRDLAGKARNKKIAPNEMEG